MEADIIPLFHISLHLFVYAFAALHLRVLVCPLKAFKLG